MYIKNITQCCTSKQTSNFIYHSNIKPDEVKFIENAI